VARCACRAMRYAVARPMTTETKAPKCGLYRESIPDAGAPKFDLRGDRVGDDARCRPVKECLWAWVTLSQSRRAIVVARDSWRCARIAYPNFGSTLNSNAAWFSPINDWRCRKVTVVQVSRAKASPIVVRGQKVCVNLASGAFGSAWALRQFGTKRRPRRVCSVKSCRQGVLLHGQPRLVPRPVWCRRATR